MEGYGRKRYKTDFIRFLTISHSSCDETTEWLEYIKDCYPELTFERNQNKIIDSMESLKPVQFENCFTILKKNRFNDYF